eukprot:767945-Hanusia_phi.AAC.7
MKVKANKQEEEGSVNDDASAGKASDAASSTGDQNSPSNAENQKAGATIFSNMINQFQSSAPDRKRRTKKRLLKAMIWGHIGEKSKKLI